MNIPNPMPQDLNQYEEVVRKIVRGYIEADEAKRATILEKVAQTFNNGQPVVMGSVGMPNGIGITLES